MSADTLRYSEKIGLLPRVSREGSGARVYNDKDLSRLRFIQRSQKMNFSLAEIAKLLQIRDAPQRARRDVRNLAEKKLAEIENSLKDLNVLRRELRLPINLCTGGRDGCPIIRRIDKGNSD
ncbi:MAG: heavy metal-responsive transcriptional regulator [Candidatus Muproteobacteria bacterium RBG_16_60_9]|uniref:Heavy metal-responsive transcriptional regulator n=1 Tax=Candidatus Muproteobacteria bacterium RBG_16_60_9 TaxID=1817755 RepID=A0A1F6V2L0_9PROT|nr:MAG: heavy metal-responsive transcriptional regulator [Candidatus Muproteobacteria bacterium RBG_16_60_9]